MYSKKYIRIAVKLTGVFFACFLIVGAVHELIPGLHQEAPGFFDTFCPFCLLLKPLLVMTALVVIFVFHCPAVAVYCFVPYAHPKPVVVRRESRAPPLRAFV